MENEEAVVIAEIVVQQTLIGDEGEPAVSCRYSGSQDLSQLLGMLEFAKMAIWEDKCVCGSD